MCNTYPGLLVLPILGLSYNAAQYLWKLVDKHMLPIQQVLPDLQWKPQQQRLQLWLWYWLQHFWILPWDWRMPGTRLGDFWSLLSLIENNWQNFHKTVWRETGTVQRIYDFSAFANRGCMHYAASPWKYNITFPKKILFMISEPAEANKE